jgi:hypothetical protein
MASDYADRSPDPGALVTAVRSLAHARQSGDPTAIHRALIEIAARALAWAEQSGAGLPTEYPS